MAPVPSRSLRPAFPPLGALHACTGPIHVLMRAGRADDAARLCAATVRLAEHHGDLPTAVEVGLLGALAHLNAGRPADADIMSREVLARLRLLSRVDEPDPSGFGRVGPGLGNPGGQGLVSPDDLPGHARFWRAEALALLARSAVRTGAVLVAMDHLADAMATIDDVPPVTEDDAAACLVLATVLSSVLLLEPAADLAGRALVMMDRLTGRDPTPDGLNVRTSLARRVAESHALAAGYISLGSDEADATRHYASAASAACRHARAAQDSAAADEQDAARVFLAFADLGLRAPYHDRALARADEEEVRAAVDRLGRVVVLGPGRGRAPLGRIVLARLRAARGDREGARAVLEEDEPPDTTGGRSPGSVSPGSGSPWVGLTGVTRAQIEDEAGHPAVALWRELAVAAGIRLWRERDARFVDLRQRIVQRQLRWRRAATEGELLRDPLTGLGNRRRLAIELERDVSSVLFIDVDRFKEINDSCGHEAGDLVLRRLAAILRSCSRTPDVVIRYGGDEFVVVLDRGSNAVALGERVLDRVRREDWASLTGGRPLTVSVGAASALTLGEALRQSDTAMLAAKAAGRDAMVVGDR